VKSSGGAEERRQSRRLGDLGQVGDQQRVVPPVEGDRPSTSDRISVSRARRRWSRVRGGHRGPCQVRKFVSMRTLSGFTMPLILLSVPLSRLARNTSGGASTPYARGEPAPRSPEPQDGGITLPAALNHKTAALRSPQP
jgi:hypothetical protein